MAKAAAPSPTGASLTPSSPKHPLVPAPAPLQGGRGFLLGSQMETSHGPREIPASCGRASQYSPMGSDHTAIVISSVFLGVGFVIAKFFPEAALLAAVFLVGLAVLNVALVLVA